MTKDKFQSLCDRILIPRMGDLLHRQLSPVHDTLEVMAAELVRIGRRLDHLASEQRPDDRGD